MNVAGRTQKRRCVAALAGLVPLAFWAGCGGGSPPAAAPAPAAAAQAAPVAIAAAPIAATTAAPRSTATKWIGGIPYDVFFDRPLEVASDQTPLVTGAAAPAMANATPVAPAAATPQPAPAAAATPAPAASTAAAGAIDWAAVAPQDQLLEEVTRLRNELTTKLNTLADYNKNWETIGVDATALAAIAGVVEQHPGEVSWKANAPLVRHLSSEINANAAKTGRSAYDATKAPFDSLVDLLSGNPPAGVTADPNLPFGDYADRSVLMASIESSLNYAKSNVNTEARLTEDATEAKRKMTVLATLMTIVATPSYGSTDEAEYQEYAQTFIKAALAGREAVDAKDLPSFTEAVNVMQKTCAECHAKYAI